MIMLSRPSRFGKIRLVYLIFSIGHRGKMITVRVGKRKGTRMKFNNRLNIVGLLGVSQYSFNEAVMKLRSGRVIEEGSSKFINMQSRRFISLTHVLFSTILPHFDYNLDLLNSIFSEWATVLARNIRIPSLRSWRAPRGAADSGITLRVLFTGGQQASLVTIPDARSATKGTGYFHSQ